MHSTCWAYWPWRQGQGQPPQERWGPNRDERKQILVLTCGEEKDNDWGDLAHPFPESDLQKFAEDEDSIASAWKLEFIWYLVSSQNWKDTEGPSI